MKNLLKLILVLLICNSANSQNVKFSIDSSIDGISVRLSQYQKDGKLFIANNTENSLVENLVVLENGIDTSACHKYSVKITGENCFLQSNINFGLEVQDGSGIFLTNGNYLIEILDRKSNEVLYTTNVQLISGKLSKI